MLNGRLYFHAWLIAIVALLVAFLTLQPEETPIDAEQAPSFDAARAERLASDLVAAAPERPPGSPQAAAWVEAQFRALPGGNRVATQKALARVDAQSTTITNVFFTVPAQAQTKSTRNILVIAPRDAPRGSSGGAHSTAMLVEMARRATQGFYHHPIIFLSADGGTFGNAGTRWYLNSVQTSRIAGVIVLDAPAAGTDREIHVWSSGVGRQALGMRQLAEKAIAESGFTTKSLPSLREQLLRQAITETRGEQRAAIDAGVPAVTLAGREEAVLPSGPDTITNERLQAAGTAAVGLIGLLDVKERANAPDASLAYADRILRPSVARLSLLLLGLPLFVMAFDAAARVRRARVRVSLGMRAVGWRMVPPFVALLAAHLLALWGFLRGPDIGRPPAVRELPFNGAAILTVSFLVLAGIATWMLLRHRVEALGVLPPAEAAGALVWLALVTIIAWWLSPFSLVLILPAAHAALAATVVARRWQVAVLAGVALTAPVAVVMMIANDIDRGPLTALWYLCQTTVSGARGLVGPILVVLVAVCVVSLGNLVAFRARKGLVVSGRVKVPRILTKNLFKDKATEGEGDGGSGETTRRRPITRRDP